MAKPTAPRGPYLLDTSALLTFIEDEPGSDRVEKVLRNAAILLPWPVLMETYYITLQEKGRAEADRRYALIRQLRAEILWAMDGPILLTATRLTAEHHVSLADAVVFDGRNLYEPGDVEAAGLAYYGIGRGRSLRKG